MARPQRGTADCAKLRSGDPLFLRRTFPFYHDTSRRQAISQKTPHNKIITAEKQSQSMREKFHPLHSPAYNIQHQRLQWPNHSALGPPIVSLLSFQPALSSRMLHDLTTANSS